MKRRNIFCFIYLLLLFAALSAPYRFYTLNLSVISSFSVIEPILALGMIFVTLNLMKNGCILIGPRFLFFVLFVPVILSSISLFWSQNIAYTLNETAVAIESCVAYIVVVNLTRKQNRDRLLTILLFFSILLLLIPLISYPPFSFLSPQFPGGETSDGFHAYLLSYYARLSHPYIGLSNNFATILAIVLPVILCIGRYFHSKPWLFLSALFFGAIIGTLSRGVLLAITGAFLMAFLLQLGLTQKIRKTFFRYFFFVVTIGCIVAVIIYFTVPKMPAHLIDRTELTGMTVRFITFRESLPVIFERPVFGYGAGMPFSNFSEYGLTSIHNTFLQRFFWYGLPFGSIASLCIISLPFIYKQIPCHDLFQTNVKKGVVIALSCQILLMLSEASWEGSVLRVIIYAFLGLTTALLRTRPVTDCGKIGVHQCQLT